MNKVIQIVSEKKITDMDMIHIHHAICDLLSDCGTVLVISREGKDEVLLP